MDHEVIIEHMKCPLCKQIFECAKRLPCGHNVCQACLKSHIIRTVPMIGCNIQEYTEGTTPEKKPSAETFKCPIDEEDVHPLHSNEDVSTWAYQFDNNLNIVTLVEILHGKATGQIQLCNNCIQMSQKVPATSVCFACFELYCMQCAFIHRHTHPKDTMLNLSAVQGLLSDKLRCEEKGEMDSHDPLPTCKIHLFSHMNSFCMDCKLKCCRKCQQTIHSKCKHVHKMHSKEKMFETNGTLPGRLKELVEKTSMMLKGDLDLLDKVEQLQPSENDAHASNFENMKADLRCQITHWEVQYEHIQKSLQQIENCPTTQSLYQFDLECQQVEKEVEYHTNYDADYDSRLQRFKNLLNTKVNKNLKMGTKPAEVVSKAKINNNGQIKTDNFEWNQFEKFRTENRVIDATQKVQLRDKLDMKASDDTEDCWLTDCVFINDEFILVADSSNKCLKWTLRTKYNDKVKLNSSPKGLAVDEDNGKTGGVTLPQDRIVQLFGIADGKVFLTEQIKTKEMCYGIGFLDNSIIVSCIGNLNSSVIILSTEGEELRTLTCDGLLKETLFSEPRYITVHRKRNEANVFVTDFRKSDITCLTIPGVEKISHVEKIIHDRLRFPLGLDTDADGNLIVCANALGEVHQITEGSERQHRLLAQELWQPRAVSFLKG